MTRRSSKANDVRGIAQPQPRQQFCRGAVSRLLTAASGWPAGRCAELATAEGRFPGRAQPDRRGVRPGVQWQQAGLQDRIDELVGLSWEQFRRAVILPQGICRLPSSRAPTRRSALLGTDDRHRALLRHFGPDP